MGKDEPLLFCPLGTAEPSRNYARVPGYKKKYKKKTRKRREKKRKMNGVEINTRAYVATRLLLRWDYLYSGISFFCSKLCLKKLSTSASRIDFKLCMITLLA